jgi:peptidylprolyl isomerase
MKRITSGIVAAALLLALAACSPAKVADKKYVSVAYTLTLADGTELQKTDSTSPYEFIVGAGTAMPSFEQALVGLKVGEKKTFTVKSADAYGDYNSTTTQDVPRAQWPSTLELKVGAEYPVQMSSGDVVLVKIAKITSSTVSVYFNHPLAGKDLTFAVEILKIRDATKAELSAAQTATQATPQ